MSKIHFQKTFSINHNRSMRSIERKIHFHHHSTKKYSSSNDIHDKSSDNCKIPAKRSTHANILEYPILSSNYEISSRHEIFKTCCDNDLTILEVSTILKKMFCF